MMQNTNEKDCGKASIKNTEDKMSLKLEDVGKMEDAFGEEEEEEEEEEEGDGEWWWW